MIVSMIMARTKDDIVGIGDKLPWHSKEDFAWFKEHTVGKAILMGRTTLEGIGKPLPKRFNLVLTRDSEYLMPGAYTVTNIEKAIQMAKLGGYEELVICGGPQVYELAKPFITKHYLTVMLNYYPGDVKYPLPVPADAAPVKRGIDADYYIF